MKKNWIELKKNGKELKKFDSDTYCKLMKVWMAELLLKIIVLVVKEHHLSLAIGNLTWSIQKTQNTTTLRLRPCPRSAMDNRCIRHSHLWRGTSPGTSWLLFQRHWSNQTDRQHVPRKHWSNIRKIPEKSVTDCSAQYTSKECENFAKSYNFEHVLVSPKHPLCEWRSRSSSKNCHITVEKKQRQEQSTTRIQSDPYYRDQPISISALYLTQAKYKTTNSTWSA